MEFIVQVKAIQKYLAEGYDIESIASNTWNIVLRKLYPNILLPESRGGYDVVISKNGERVGLEVKESLSMMGFQMALGQCITRLCKHKGVIDKAIIPYRFADSDDLELYEKTIAIFNLPITLQQIDVKQEEMNLKYWYEYVEGELISPRKRVLLSRN